MRILGKHHARDIHTWDRGQCGFHSLKDCTCGSCEDDNVICSGKDHHTKHPLTCPFHALAYEIECCVRADQASHIIHTELGRGHSNYPEASHNVLVRFRSKDKYLQNIHYTVSTNLGLLQANMTWLGKKHGLSYHWLLDLFTRLKLPIFNGMPEALKKANEVRSKNLAKKQTDEAKDKRTDWKKARVQEQEERKQWSRRQTIYHTYGSDDDNEDEDNVELREGGTEQCGSKATNAVRQCKCGSSEHRYTSHRNCPLNKKRVEAE